MQRGLLRTLLLSAAVPCVVPLGAHGATPSRLVRAVPPRARAAPLAGARKQTWLYVANYGDNDVAIYRADGLNFTLISELKTGISGPAGISLDPAGTLYVANYNNASVTVYPAGETSPSLTLTQGITQALDAAIDSAGNVWVANRGSKPSILIFPPGEIEPSITITSSLIKTPNQIVFDATGNAYVADDAVGVYEIPLGSTQPMSINLDDLSTPSGLAYDPLADDLIVGNISRGPFLSVYRLGDPTAIRQIGSGISADFLGIGNIGRTEYLLAPDSDGNQVSFFTHDKKLAGTLTAGDAPHGVVVKPLGVP